MEEVIAQFGETRNLHGIVTLPAQNGNNIGVILVNAGFVHKVGPNRVYVKMARELSNIGHTVMRFDFSGIGDSEASNESKSAVKRKDDEIKSCIDYLERNYNTEEFILVGICSGADAAFNYAGYNARVCGYVLINGYLVDDGDMGYVYQKAQVSLQKRYYSQSVYQPQRIKRLLTGKSNYKGIIKSLIKTKQKGQQINIEKWKEIENNSQISLLLIYSMGSVSFDIYNDFLRNNIEKKEHKCKVTCEIAKNTDHLFTLTESQNFLIKTTINYIHSIF